jgi:hypothetical protein
MERRGSAYVYRVFVRVSEEKNHYVVLAMDGRVVLQVDRKK